MNECNRDKFIQENEPLNLNHQIGWGQKVMNLPKEIYTIPK